MPSTRRFRRALVLFVSLALLAVRPDGAQAFPEPCAEATVDNTACLVSGSGGSSSGGSRGGAAPEPTPCVDGEACWETTCQILIADDSIYPDGVMWDGNEASQPVGGDDPFLVDPDDMFIMPSGDDIVLIGDDPNLSWVNAAEQLREHSMPAGNWAETGQWQACATQDSNGVVETSTAAFGPVGPLIDVDGLFAAARTAAVPPRPPLVHAPPDAAVVKLPMWLWVEASYWHSYVGTASSPSGRLTIRAETVPQFTVWQTPEGDLECDGPGVAWEYGLDPRNDTDCLFIFKHASSYHGGEVTVSGTAVFDGSWSMNFDNGVIQQRGIYARFGRQSSFDIEIHEIQALVVSEPGASADD